MKVKTTGRKVNLKPSFIEMATKRLSKFDRFFDEEPNATVTVTLERDRHTVEITVKSRGFIYRTERTTLDMESAFNEAADHLMRQIIKNKGKLGNRVKTREVDMAMTELDYIPTETTDEDYRIAREKRFMVEPMTEQEAILQMDMLGHTFFVFKNSATNELNIVYRRNEGSYGLLVPIE